MLLEIIDEINKALENDLYYAALTMILTIPDICGKAEFPDEKQDKLRYIAWYDKYIGDYDHSPVEEGEEPFPYVNGEVTYQLRCSVLHQGDVNVDVAKIKKDECKIDTFVLVKEPKNEFDIYADFSTYNSLSFSATKKREYHLNLRRFALIVCASAKSYYEDNKDKFVFFNYKIVDFNHAWDRRI